MRRLLPRARRPRVVREPPRPFPFRVPIRFRTDWVVGVPARLWFFNPWLYPRFSPYFRRRPCRSFEGGFTPSSLLFFRCSSLWYRTALGCRLLHRDCRRLQRLLSPKLVLL